MQLLLAARARSREEWERGRCVWGHVFLCRGVLELNTAAYAAACYTATQPDAAPLSVYCFRAAPCSPSLSAPSPTSLPLPANRAVLISRYQIKYESGSTDHTAFWLALITALITALRPSLSAPSQPPPPPANRAVFISIYESGSTDRTAFWLHLLRLLLCPLGVQYHIEVGGKLQRARDPDTERLVERIQFLAQVRWTQQGVNIHVQVGDQVVDGKVASNGRW